MYFVRWCTHPGMHIKLSNRCDRMTSHKNRDTAGMEQKIFIPTHFVDDPLLDVEYLDNKILLYYCTLSYSTVQYSDFRHSPHPNLYAELDFFGYNQSQEDTPVGSQYQAGGVAV